MQRGGVVSAPSRYGALIGVMRDMHWSWGDLMAAPADLVEEVIERTRAQAHWSAQKADFDRTMNNG